MGWISLKGSKHHAHLPSKLLHAQQELLNQGQAVDCFCHNSLLSQPCFQHCHPPKPMAERQLPLGFTTRSVYAAFPLQAFRTHLVTWMSPFYLAPSSTPCLDTLRGETARGESLEPADSGLGGGDSYPFLSSDYRRTSPSRRWVSQG